MVIIYHDLGKMRLANSVIPYGKLSKRCGKCYYHICLNESKCSACNFFQSNVYSRIDGKHLRYIKWKRLYDQPFAKLEVFSCFTKKPNCTLHGDVTSQRPEFIEISLQMEQPANTKEHQCVGIVASFDMLHAVWITVPCDMKFSATFMCEDILNNTKIHSQNVSASSVSTSYHLRRKGNHTVLTKPTVSCPFPWLPGQEECFTLKPTGRPAQITLKWLTQQCDLLNASVFIAPDVYFETGSNMRRTHPRDNMLSLAEHELAVRGLTHLVMKGEHPSQCVLYYVNEVGIAHHARLACSAIHAGGLPELLHVLCIQSFPEVDTLPYSMTWSFTCSDTGAIIHDSFRCDGITQCDNRADEVNCTSANVPATDCSPFSLQMHKNTDCLMCPEFYTACGDGSCVPQDVLCNGLKDCEDGWDEQICVFNRSELFGSLWFLPNYMFDNPSMLSVHKFGDLYGLDYIIRDCEDGANYDATFKCIFEYDSENNVMHCPDGSHLFNCEPVGCPWAFKCSMSYCIPLRQVCDGITDCPFGEEEANCEQLQCPELLRCRQSAVCLSPYDVCDGTVHCKDFMDDEIYCAPCPHGMHCQGNAAVCTNNPHVITHNTRKAYAGMKVVHCHYKSSLPVLAAFKWLILTYLDVQHSEISHLDFDLLFPHMKVLSYLNAAFNRIALISSKSAVKLKVINLSHNMIGTLRAFGLSQFSNLITLVLHHNDISVIQRWAFFNLTSLVSIDISHNSLAIHEVSDLPRLSMLLEHFQSDILDLCCLLSHVPHCTPESSLFSSCENLLHLTVHRVLITGQAVFTLLANSAVFIFRRHLNEKEKFQMFHLTASNLLMSVYLMMMTGVDIFYRNRFASIAVGWNSLSLCKIAASANMIAAEVSLSLLLFIFLLRAYTVQKVLSTIYISSRFKEIVCFVIWTVWVVYASTFVGLLTLIDSPLESNICILVYLTDVKGSLLVQVHSLVYVVVNMLQITALIISFGFIAYKVLHKKAITQDVSAHRARRNRNLAIKLFIMFFFSICCWIPIISSVSLSLIGVPMPNDVPVWMAIIVVPINASFCPIMYCLLPMLVNPAKK